MPEPRNPYEAVLHAARDVARLDCALDAELLGTALLGSVYAVAATDRGTAVREFVGGFLDATARRRSASAATIRQVFAALVPDAPGAAAVRPGGAAPAWTAQLGRVHPTGCWAYGDVYGDQTSYLVTFAYDDVAGGPEHAVVALVDHNIGITKDVFVTGGAGGVLDRVRAMCADDEMTWFRTEDPGRARAAVQDHLEITDGLSELPADGSLATDRALAASRLGLLPAPRTPVPAPPEPDRDRLVRDFLAAPEAAGHDLTGLDDDAEASLRFCLSLLLDHAADLPDADPLRWSPSVAGLFLLDWVHRRAVLDMDDAALLPRVVRAWAAYAARRRGLPAGAAAEVSAAVEELVPEFARLYATGERRSPATAAVARLIADGVDPSDTSAIEAWLATDHDRPGEDRPQ